MNIKKTFPKNQLRKLAATKSDPAESILDALKSCSRPWWRGVSAAVLSGGLVLSAPFATAEIVAQFQGGASDTQVSTAGNWVGGSAPTPSANLKVIVSGSLSGREVDFDLAVYRVGKISVTAPNVGTGTVNFTSSALSGGSLSVSSIDVARRASASFDTNVDVNAEGVLNVNQTSGATAGSVEIGALSGGQLVVHGGTVTLTSANDYHGGTDINAGKIIAENALSLGTLGTVTVVASGELSVGDAVTVGGLTLNGGVVSDSGGGHSIAIFGGGTISANAGVVSAEIADDSGAQTSVSKQGSGTLELLGANTYTGTTTVSGGIVEVGTSNAFGTGSVVLNSGTVRVSDTVAAASLSSGLSIAGSVTLSGGTGDLVQAGTVDLGGAKQTVTVLGNVTISGRVIDGGSSSGGIVKEGAGTLTLTSANDYHGGTDINAGKIVAGNALSLGTLGTVTVVASGELSVGDAVTVGGLTLNGGVVSDAGGGHSIAIVGGGTISANAGVVSAVIADDSGAQTSVSKQGSGNLTLSAVNLYSGGTKLSGGVLTVADEEALGSGAVTIEGGTLAVDSASGPFHLGNEVVVVGNIHLDGGSNGLIQTGTVNLSEANRTINVANFVTIQGNVIDGGTTAASLTKEGAGTLKLELPKTYTGGTTVKAGVLEAEGSALGSGVITVDGGTLSTGFNASSSLEAKNGLEIKAGNIVGSGSVVVTGTIRASGSGSATVTAVLADGTTPSKLSKTGSGDLNLLAANTFTGGSEINGGKVSVGTSTALGSGSVNLSGGTLAAQGANPVTVRNSIAVSGNAGLDGGSSELDLAGTIDLVGDKRTLSISSRVLVSGTIQNGGITKSGAGILTLSGTNTYSGGTKLESGTLNITSAGALGTGSLTVSGGSLKADVDLTISGPVSGDYVNSGSGTTVTLGADNSSTINSMVVVAGTVKAAVDGSLGKGPINVFSGAVANTTSVPTYNVTKGSLTVNGQLNGGTVKLTGQTVKGSGVIEADVVLDGGTVSPGNSPGVLQVRSLKGTGDYAWERISTGTIGAVPPLIVGGSAGSITPYDSIIITNGAGSDLSHITFKPLNSVTGSPIPVASLSAGADSFAYDSVKGINRYVGVIQSSGTLSSVPQFGGQNTAVITVSLKLANGTSGGTTIDLVVDRSSYAKFAGSASGAAFGKYLDNSLQDHYEKTDSLGVLMRKLDTIVTADAVNALLRANDAGYAYANLFSTSVKRAMAVAASLDDRLDGLAAAGANESVFSFGVGGSRSAANSPTMLTPNYQPDGSDHAWAVWTAGYGNDFTVDFDSALGGRIKSNDWGSTAGMERMFGNVRVGILGAFGRGDANFDGTAVSSDHWTAGGYSAVAIGPVSVDVSALWGRSDEKATRSTAKADFGTGTTQLGAGISVNLLDRKSGWQLTPIARVKYVDYTQDAFEETGTGLLYKTAKVNESATISKLGMRLGHRSELSRSVTLGLDGSAFWVHDFDADGRPITLQVVGASPFTSFGRKSDADSAQFHLGIQATFSDAWTIRLSGQQDVANHRSQSAGIFSVALSF